MYKRVKRIVWALLAALILFVIWYAWPRLPIITAFASKGMCSSVFLADKDPSRVRAEDLSFFPISLAKTKIDFEERSVTSTLFGLAKRKAIYRDGLGAVIVLNTSEEDLRAQSFQIPEPGYDPDTLPWPKGNLLPPVLPDGVDYDQLDEIIENAFDLQGDEPLRKTLGVAVIYDGAIIGEKYLDGYDASTMFHNWSMTKSFGGSLIGILREEGKLDINAPLGIEAWANDDRKGITVENVLHMSSGLDWVENYFTISEATRMLMQSDDMLDFITGCDAAYEPGSHWIYSGGDANLLSGVIRRIIGDDNEYHAFPYTALLHRIGMLNTNIETDATGLYVLSSYCYGTVRDWARFGLLFLNNGVFAGDTIISPEWVEYCRTAAPRSGDRYGATFWLEEPNPLNKLKDVPDDVFFADGFLGQRSYIIPSENLVVVRMGYGMKNFSMNDFLREVIATLPQD